MGWGDLEMPEDRGGSVHVLSVGHATRVVLQGEVDAALQPDLDDAAAAVADLGLPVEIDAQHVTFLDSAAVAFLARVLARSARPAVVLQPPPMMTFLLEMTGLGDLVRVVDGPGDDPTTAPA